MNILATTRLNKYISESLGCSRREADKYIEAGRVIMNGKRAKLGDQVGPKDKVMVNGLKLDQIPAKDFILIALNKPVGVTTTTEGTSKSNIIDFVNHSDRIFPIGRLDKDSQGLILLTNNGDIVNKILRAGNKHEKEYLVTVSKPITDQFITDMSKGVPILGKVTRKCLVVRESPFIFRIILTQGLNRQIRRMCEHFKYEVTKLERVRVMNITLKGLPLGDWRQLDEEEVGSIMKSVEKSSSTAKTSKARPKYHKDYFSKGVRKVSSSESKETGKPIGKGKPERKLEEKVDRKRGSKPSPASKVRSNEGKPRVKTAPKGRPAKRKG